ncbi:MAG TPA: hypothetical protein VKZ72_07945 [Acidimicrobiales bacterium]|nr:hypothetical protein [Acidimicrobiales bacterium]
MTGRAWWPKAGSLLAEARPRLAADPGAAARIDQAGAVFRDELDELDVDLHDPEHVRIGLAWLAAVTRSADVLVADGLMTRRGRTCVRAAVAQVVLGLDAYIPEEARRAG